MRSGEIEAISVQRRLNTWQKAGVFFGGAIAGSAAFIGIMNQAEVDTTLGAHNVSVAPTFDGTATVDIPTLAAFRMPLDSPLSIGTNIVVKDTGNFDSLVQQDAVIATDPEGETERIEKAVRNMMLGSALGGLLMGSCVSVYLYSNFRKSPENSNHRLRKLGAGFSLIAIGASAAGCAIPGNILDLTGNNDSEQWVRLNNVVPIVSAIDSPLVDKIEVKRTATIDVGAKLITSSVERYISAKDYYRRILDQVPGVAYLIRQPSENETVVIQVSDRHDNIPMDKVARAIGDAGGASTVLDTGDDLSMGADLEAFSLDSLNHAFKDYNKVVSIGNHDKGDFVKRHLKELGWTVLSGEVVTVGGINWLGDDDVRTSSLDDLDTVSDEELEKQMSDQAHELADVACAEEQPVTMAPHEDYASAEALARGCVQAAFSGHDHVQSGPTVITGENGNDGVTYTNGTTGGAQYAFALGDKLRRDAEVALHTFRDGVYMGTQPIVIKMSGDIVVKAFVPGPAYSESLQATKARLGDRQLRATSR